SFTWVAPPVITSVVNNNAPFNQSAVATLQNDRFIAAVDTQMAIAGTSFAAPGATVFVYRTGLPAVAAQSIGDGARGATVTTTAPLITGQSPRDQTLSGNVPVTVRVTNPDGQFGEFQTLYTTSNVRPNFNGSFDVGTNSENQIAVNPVNPLNAV